MNPARTILACLILLAGAGAPARASATALQVLHDCVWLAAPGDDGDSFEIRCGDRTLRVRLYFVDTPEVTTEGRGMAARVSAQRRHFGLARDEQVLACGRQASDFTRAALAQPFTVYTAFTDARGEGGRVYAFVRTAAGVDLGSALVDAGLARGSGYTHESPDGASIAAVRADLARREAVARVVGAGAWQRAAGGRRGADRPAPETPPAQLPCGPAMSMGAPVVLLLVLVLVLAVWAGLWGRF